MRFVLAGLVIAAASACSAHNSHSVVLDPVEALPPLVDEALQNLQQAFGEPLPIDFVAVGVAVEPVSVRWVAPAHPAEALQIESILAEAVKKRVRPTAPEQALYVLKIALVMDLNDPDEAAMLVSTELDESGERAKTLAYASSGFVTVERLYCHGCRDSLGSIGTHIERASSGSGDYGAGYFGAGIYYQNCNSGSAGYTKH